MESGEDKNMAVECVTQRRHFKPRETGTFIKHRNFGDFYGVGTWSDPPMAATTTAIKDMKLRRQPIADSQRETQLFRFRMKDACTSSPFSDHDNRHGHENTGHYFDEALGRRKQTYRRQQHVSADGYKWNPSDDGLCMSIQRGDFVRSQTADLVSQERQHRRFPKFYEERQRGCNHMTLPTAWNAGHATIPTQLLATTQEPRKKLLPWRYSTHRYHN